VQPVHIRVPSRAAPRVRPWLVTIALTCLALTVAGPAHALAWPAATSTTPATSTSTPALFNRLTFDNTPSSSDSHLRVVVVQQSYAVPSYIASLRSKAPGITVLAYQTLWWLRPADKQGLGDCLPGTGTYPESWYLHNGSGQRETWNPGTSAVRYGMDFGNTAFLQACTKHLVSGAKAIGADGVFLDGAPSSVHWAQLPTACTPSPPAAATCASDANFQKAMTAALGYVTSTLHANGLRAFVNISGGNVTFCCQGGPAIWQQYVSRVDGAMQEAWTYGTNHLPLPGTEVQAGLLNTAWSEAHGKYTLVNDDITKCESCSDYGLATMLLVGGGHSSYDIANGIYTGTSNGVWWPSYTTAQSLGVPLGAYTTLADGLMVRHFASGYVVVNDTAAAISDPAYGRVNATSALIR
jgi:hypothetical protein